MIDPKHQSIYIRKESISLVLSQDDIELWGKALRMVATANPLSITGRNCAEQHRQLACMTGLLKKEDAELQALIPQHKPTRKTKSERGINASSSIAEGA